MSAGAAAAVIGVEDGMCVGGSNCGLGVCIGGFGLGLVASASTGRGGGDRTAVASVSAVPPYRMSSRVLGSIDSDLVQILMDPRATSTRNSTFGGVFFSALLINGPMA